MHARDACWLSTCFSHCRHYCCLQAYDRVAPVVQDAATTASPYVKSALTTAQDVAAPALRAVEPSVKVLLSAIAYVMQPVMSKVG